MSQSPTSCMLARLCCGVLALASAGCQTYPPYGYGGYPGNYGYPAYSQPGQVMPYSGPGVIQGAPLGQPNGFQPNGYPGSAAPPFNSGVVPPNPNVPSRGADNSVIPPVPNVPNDGGGNFGTEGQFPGSTSTTRPQLPPDDPIYSSPAAPSASRRPVVTPNDIADPADIKSELDGAKRAVDKLNSSENEPIGNPKTTMRGDEFDGVEFTPPVTTRGAGGSHSNIVQTAQQVAVQNPNVQPYGRAINGHAWFRGIIDYDKQENTWYLIYNPTPEISDQLGGMITLIDHPHLQHFSADDYALVEGAFDPSESDANGNAKYRIVTIRRLVP